MDAEDFFRNSIVYLSQLSAYPREEILQFRNVGKNGVILCSWNDQYLFEIISQRNSVQLIEEYGIIAVSQLSDCNERQLKVVSDSIPALSSLIEKLLTDTHMGTGMHRFMQLNQSFFISILYELFQQCNYGLHESGIRSQEL